MLGIYLYFIHDDAKQACSRTENGNSIIVCRGKKYKTILLSNK